MGRFATGKNSYGISDRSGFRYRLRDMRKEWNGLTVGYDEYEAKHPQLDPRYHPTDPQSLQYAKPQIANSTCFVGLVGVNTNRFASVGMQPKTDAKETRLQSFTGNVTVSTS